MTYRQSVSLPMFRTVLPDREAALPLLAEIGFDGVEIWGRDEHLGSFCQAARREGLPVCAMVGSGLPLNDPGQHAAAEQALRESIAIAADEGIGALICFSGPRREALNDAEAVPVIAEGLSRVVEEAEARGVTLLLELLNSKVNHPGYQLDHTAMGVEICRRIDSPRVRLLYDIYHMQIMEGDVIRTIRDNIEWIGHFHTAGNPGRNDLDETQELNYAAIARAVAATGYAGFVGHEFTPKKEVQTALREAYTFWHP